MSASSVTHDRPWSYRLEGKAAGSASRARRQAGVVRLFAVVLRECRARRGTRQLMALEDRMLRDIGLARGEIERAGRTGRELA